VPTFRPWNIFLKISFQANSYVGISRKEKRRRRESKERKRDE
jgi:hypothetical protein